MRPLTKGEGSPSYTLYVPFWTSHSSRFTLAALIPPLQSALGAHYALDTVEGRGKEILRIQGFATLEAAQTAFARIKMTASLLSLESNSAITVEGEVHAAAGSYLGLPHEWTFADSPWPPDPVTGRVRIDGVANILVPTIVPEHQRIIDAGGLVGEIVRPVASGSVQATVQRAFSRPPVHLSSSAELAMQAYLNASSQENPKLRFLGFVTCLEVMSQPKKSQFKRDAIRTLIEHHRGIVTKSLPADHPHAQTPKDAVEWIYKIRNKLAHEGHWGPFSPDHVHRSIQFLNCVTRVLLQDVLQS